MDYAPPASDFASLPRLSEVAAVARALRGNATPQGLSFVHLVKVLALSDGSVRGADIIASEHYAGDEKLSRLVKAVVAAGSISTLSQLAPYQQLADEFIAAATASSITLRLDNARRVPFRVRVAKVTSSGTPAWVGEGAPKPASALATDNAIVLDPKKVACIVVISEDLARFSSPAADALVRADLTAAINSMVDAAFVSATAGSASRPAGILATITPVTSTGSTPQAIAHDIGVVAANMITAGARLLNPVLLIGPALSLSLGLQANATSPTLPRTIVSASVPAGQAILIDESELLLADEGFEISASTQANVMMDSAPIEGTTAYRSLWQFNLIGIRAERFTNWAPAVSAARTAGYVNSIA